MSLAEAQKSALRHPQRSHKSICFEELEGNQSETRSEVIMLRCNLWIFNSSQRALINSLTRCFSK